MGTAGKIALVGVVLIGGYFVIRAAVPAMGYGAVAPSTGQGGGSTQGSTSADKVKSWIGVGQETWSLVNQVGTDLDWWGKTTNPTSGKPQ